MLIVHVAVHVKPGCVEAFKAASLENARNSVLEPGIARFDVVQEADDPARFVLVEAYRTPQAPAAHKETAHYPLARHRRPHDGRAPHQREIRERVPCRRGLVRILQGKILCALKGAGRPDV
jgi:quinol monooxygenase YgiN